MAQSNATPKKFSIQQVLELLLRDPQTKGILAYLDNLKTSGLENTVEMVYPTGGRGNTYIGGGFAHSRRASLKVENATWNTEVMAVQNGTQIATENVNVVEYETTEITGTTAATKYSAIGAAGSEILYVYELNDDGTYGTKYEQATSAASGKFSYASGVITFSSALNGKIAYAYTRPAVTGAQKLTVKTDGVPDTVLVTGFGLAKDVCDGQLYMCQIDGQAQVDGNYTFDLSADGDPSVHALNLEFVKSCNSKKLYDFIVYDEADA